MIYFFSPKDSNRKYPVCLFVCLFFCFFTEGHGCPSVREPYHGFPLGLVFGKDTACIVAVSAPNYVHTSTKFKTEVGGGGEVVKGREGKGWKWRRGREKGGGGEGGKWVELEVRRGREMGGGEG